MFNPNTRPNQNNGHDDAEEKTELITRIWLLPFATIFSSLFLDFHLI